ncbi:uncharacterized protein LOC129946598 [Eupeodes corollae]|uniref:uncharacterized protein LOC129946598 n=1 Tax=Eupeodes corollae TaxID=290404 RepID=UPI002490273C|nr:uncharacterized protein LOC129946598 [Eupeodes corollae]
MLRIVGLFCLVLSVLAIEQVADTPQQHQRSNGGLQSFNAGKRQPGDKLIWAGKGNQVIDFARAITMELPFPEYGKINNAAITQISATTMLDSGSSQFSIQGGGVGQKNVDLKIVTNGAHRITYNIAIYGK